jgi:tape measure domain-containing protein
VATELGTGYVSIVAETSKLEAGIKKALKGSSTHADAVGRDIGTRMSAQASSSLSSGMRSVGAVGAKALGGAMLLGVGAAAAGVSAAFGAALTKGFDRLKSIDDAKFKLKALGNSAKDVQGVMDSALASVKGTAFGLGDAATIAASAIAAGVAPGQELTKYLTLTADAAAVAGTSLSDMGMIINQVRTTGSAYTEDLNQLAGRGIPIYQWLGKEAGVAAGAVKKLAADGQISSAMLEAAIEKNIGGAAKTMGESFSGSVANAQAALGRLGEAFLKPVFNQAPGGISSITEALDGMTTWINNNQGTIVSFWAAIGQAAVSTAQAVMQAVGEMTVAFGQLVGGIGNLEGSLLKIQSAGARLAGDTEGADKLLADAEKAFGRGEDIQAAGQRMLELAQGMDAAKASISGWSEPLITASEVLGRLGNDATAAKDRILAAFEGIPTNVPIDIQTPNGSEALRILNELGVKVNTDNKKQIEVSAPMAPEVLSTLEQLGIKVRSDNGKLIIVEQEGAEAAGAAIDAAAAKPRTATISVIAKYGPGIVDNPGIQKQFTNDFRAAFGAAPKAAGGAIFGAGTATSDSIPAMLSDGEHVFTAADVKAMGGQSSVYGFRAALHMAKGGDAFGDGVRKSDKRGPGQEGQDRNPFSKETTPGLQPGWGWGTSGPSGTDFGWDWSAWIKGGFFGPSILNRDKRIKMFAAGGAVKKAKDMRTEGAMPAAAGNTAKVGGSTISSFIDMGGEFINGIIDQAASAAATAASASAMAGSFGAAGPVGGEAAGAAAGTAVGLGTDAAKRGISFGFDLLGIGVDSILEQLTPFGQPRFLNQDVSGFVPKQAITGALSNLMGGGADQAMGLDPNTTQHGTTVGQAPGPIDSLMGSLGPQTPQPMIGDSQSFLNTQLAAPEAAPPGQQPMFKVDNIYTTDAESVGRELSRRGRLAQMQYTNRPGP